MNRIYEVTTMAGPVQRYEVIEVSPMVQANNTVGASIRTIEGKYYPQENFAGRAHQLLSQTGLEEAIKDYPARLVSEENGGIVMAKPDRLRLIYDIFPCGSGSAYPLLRIFPVEGKQVYIAEYDFSKAELPLKNFTFSNEFDGSVHMQFTGLLVSLHLRNFEKEYESYFSRDLKANLNGNAELKFK